MNFIFKTKTIYYGFLICRLFCHSFTYGKEINSGVNEAGIPFITNISPKEYNANGQNWAAVQDSNGLIYFANSGGVILQYDGARWASIPVGNGSIVRDVQLAPSGKLFVGMQNEFGYLESDENGQNIYKSLLPQIDCMDNKFGDIWKIGITDEFVYFLERHHLFRFSKKSLGDSLQIIRPIKAKTRFHNLFKGRGNHLFVHQVNGNKRGQPETYFKWYFF